MRDTELLQLALGLAPPWLVKSAAFDATGKRLDIDLDFSKGGRFACPECSQPDCPVHDTVAKSAHQVLAAPRLLPAPGLSQCPHPPHRLPGLRRQAGQRPLGAARFRLHFAVRGVSHGAVDSHAGGRRRPPHQGPRHPPVAHPAPFVEQALAGADYSEVTRVAIDETAARRGHDYISLFVDIDHRRVIHVAEGRAAATVAAFADDLVAHNGDAKAITDVSIDMGPAFIKGVQDNLPNAEITFDKFHVVKLILIGAADLRPRKCSDDRSAEAVDQVRRDEAKSRPELRHSRYLWLKNDSTLAPKQLAERTTLAALNLKTARALNLRMAFQDIYRQGPKAWAGVLIDRWVSWARRCRLAPMKKVAATIRRHRSGILAWFDSGVSNGLIEGINSLVQAAKAKARGYRSTRNLKAMTYLIAGKLELGLPT